MTNHLTAIKSEGAARCNVQGKAQDPVRGGPWPSRMTPIAQPQALYLHRGRICIKPNMAMHDDYQLFLASVRTPHYIHMLFFLFSSPFPSSHGPSCESKVNSVCRTVRCYHWSTRLALHRRVRVDRKLTSTLLNALEGGEKEEAGFFFQVPRCTHDSKKAWTDFFWCGSSIGWHDLCQVT